MQPRACVEMQLNNNWLMEPSPKCRAVAQWAHSCTIPTSPATDTLASCGSPTHLPLALVAPPTTCRSRRTSPSLRFRSRTILHSRARRVIDSQPAFIRLRKITNFTVLHLEIAMNYSWLLLVHVLYGSAGGMKDAAHLIRAQRYPKAIGKFS